MYTDYWGLKKPPFDNVPDPTMYVESHISVENTVAETLFAIEEGNECLTVIVGDVGLGKTLSLRMILDSLDHDKYKIAFVTNPDMSFVQLLREIIGQLIGKECEVRGKIELLEVFNKLIFETADEGKKVLIFIDEANAISPTNLESLRLLTNMQDDSRNLFTIVLAGQMEFAKRLEHPKRANLYQRIGTYNRIERISSEELVKNYVETRMRLAGAERPIFTNEAVHWLWEYSEHGVPRLINKIAKLCLKAGETNNFNLITDEIVQQIGERFDKMTGPAVQKRRAPEARAPQEMKKEMPPAQTKSAEAAPPVQKEQAPVFAPPPPPPPPPVVECVPETPVSVEPPVMEPSPPMPEIIVPPPPVPETDLKSETVPPLMEAPPPPPEVQTKPEPTEPVVEPIALREYEEEELEEEELEEEELEEEELEEEELEEEELEEEELEEEELEEEELEEEVEEPVIEQVVAPPPPPPVESVSEPPVSVAPPIIKTEHEPRVAAPLQPPVEIPQETKMSPPPAPSSVVEQTVQEVRTVVQPTSAVKGADEDCGTVTIAGCKISIEIPQHVVEQTQTASTDQKRKVAGVLAAQTLEKNPQLTASPTVDPVSVWSEILGVIMKRLEW